MAPTPAAIAAGIAVGSSILAIIVILFSWWKYRRDHEFATIASPGGKDRDGGEDPHEHLPRHRSTLILPGSKHLAAKITPFTGIDRGAGETIRYGFAHTPGSHMRVASRRLDGGWSFANNSSNRTTIYDSEGIRDPEPSPSIRRSGTPLGSIYSHSNYTQSDVESYRSRGPASANPFSSSTTSLVPPSPVYGVSPTTASSSTSSLISPMASPALTLSGDTFSNPFETLSEHRFSSSSSRPLPPRNPTPAGGGSIGVRLPAYHPDLDIDHTPKSSPI